MSRYLEDVLEANLNRRQVLRSGIIGSALLAGGGLLGALSGCSQQTTSGENLEVLRADDLLFFSALYPVVLSGAISQQPDIRATQLVNALHSLDRYLARLSPVLQGQTLQLLDLVNSGITRGVLTGIWSPWQETSEAQVDQFLQRWKHSNLKLLRMGYSQLMQLLAMAWYMTEESWSQIGYPGAPLSQTLITQPNNF